MCVTLGRSGSQLILALIFVTPSLWAEPVSDDGALEASGLSSIEVSQAASGKRAKGKPVDDQVTVVAHDRTGAVDWLVDKRNSWAKGWVKMASNIDGFLAGTEAESQADNSYMRLTIEEAWRESEGFESDIDLKLKMALPRAKKRWNLFVENRLESKEPLDERESPTITDNDDNSDSSGFYAGVESKRKLRGWEFAPRAGVRFRFPMQPFVSFSLKRTFDLNEHWNARSDNRVFYYHNGDRGSRHALYFERPLSGDSFFRFSNKVRFIENDNRWEYGQVASLQHRIDEKRATEASVGWNGEQEYGVSDNRYYLNWRYRQALYEDWLFWGVTPELSFAREDEYEPRWAVFTRLEVLFAQ